MSGKRKKPPASYESCFPCFIIACKPYSIADDGSVDLDKGCMLFSSTIGSNRVTPAFTTSESARKFFNFHEVGQLGAVARVPDSLTLAKLVLRLARKTGVRLSVMLDPSHDFGGYLVDHRLVLSPLRQQRP
ncbi:MAG: hypothetical protein AAGJ40_09350 [Planctomycetota bacterium]